MSVYIVFTRDETVDQKELEVYWEMAAKAREGHQIKALAFYGEHEDLEGPATEGMVIVEFPDVEAAKGWYESPAYRAAREHRFRGAKYRVTMVKGV